MPKNIEQTPQENLDYEINWATSYLGTDTIVSSVFDCASDDVVLSNMSFTSSTATFWLSGGVPANIYTITNTVTTAQGRTMQETIIYNCVAQIDI